MAENLIEFLVEFGLYDVILPFVLIFTVVYATLDKTEIFGKEQRKVNMMVAFVFGFVAIASLNYAMVINQIVAYTALFMVAAVCVLILAGNLGFSAIDQDMKMKILVAFVSLGAILVMLAGIFGWFKSVRFNLEGIKAVTTVVLAVAFFVLIIWWVTRDKES